MAVRTTTKALQSYAATNLALSLDGLDLSQHASRLLSMTLGYRMSPQGAGTGNKKPASRDLVQTYDLLRFTRRLDADSQRLQDALANWMGTATISLLDHNYKARFEFKFTDAYVAEYRLGPSTSDRSVAFVEEFAMAFGKLSMRAV